MAKSDAQNGMHISNSSVAPGSPNRSTRSEREVDDLIVRGIAGWSAQEPPADDAQRIAEVLDQFEGELATSSDGSADSVA